MVNGPCLHYANSVARLKCLTSAPKTSDRPRHPLPILPTFDKLNLGARPGTFRDNFRL